MNRAAIRAATAFVLLALPACHRGQVRLYVAPGASETVWRAKVTLEDLLPASRRLAFAIEPPIGYAMARQHPLDDYVLSTKSDWNDEVERIWGHFPKLRDRHNGAQISVKGFEDRRTELRRAVGRLLGIRVLLIRAIDAYGEAQARIDQLRFRTSEGSQMERVLAQNQIKRAGQTIERVMAVARELIGNLEESEGPASLPTEDGS